MITFKSTEDLSKLPPTDPAYTLYVVQQILGHSDPSVTQKYAHLSTQSLQDASSSASDIIKAAMKK